MTLQRIPLTIICTLNGAETDGVLVAVMEGDLAALEAEHDRLTAEVERMRGVVTEAVEAMQALITHPLLLGDRMELAMRHDTPPKWEIMPVESQALFDATRALVALTTDGGA